MSEAEIAAPIAKPTRTELFLGFTHVASLAFGGVLPWAHYILVERRRWLSEDEFTGTLALCQILPGPNIVNMSIAVGARFHGASGALCAVLGLFCVPVSMLLVIASVYGRYADLAPVRNGLIAIAAAAAGLILAMAIKMAKPLLQRRFAVAVPFMIATFVAVALMRWPLWPVLLVLVPLSTAAGWRIR